MKLLTLDLDGTLLNEDGNCTDYAFDVLVRARKKGIIVILNSGRPYYAMNEKILKLPYDYISTCNGQAIYDKQGNLVIEKEALSVEEVQKLFTVGSRYFSVANLDYETKILSGARLIFLPLALIFNFLQSFRWVGKQRVKAKQYIFYKANDPMIEANGKICFSSFNPILKIIEKEANKLGYQGFYTSSHWLEIMHSGINKGEALISICQFLNIELSETVAFGDGENDIPMLETAGYAVVMGNGMPKTKEKADVIIGNHTDDAAAHYIEDNYL